MALLEKCIPSLGWLIGLGRMRVGTDTGVWGELMSRKASGSPHNNGNDMVRRPVFLKLR